jgi:hypothetical protein
MDLEEDKSDDKKREAESKEKKRDKEVRRHILIKFDLTTDHLA